MELSKKGKKYLEKCNRIELIRLVGDYKIRNLMTDDTIIYDLADVLAYYITMASCGKCEATGYINDFLNHLISNTNDFINHPGYWIKLSNVECHEDI